MKRLLLFILSLPILAQTNFTPQPANCPTGTILLTGFAPRANIRGLPVSVPTPICIALGPGLKYSAGVLDVAGAASSAVHPAPPETIDLTKVTIDASGNLSWTLQKTPAPNTVITIALHAAAVSSSDGTQLPGVQALDMRIVTGPNSKLLQIATDPTRSYGPGDQILIAYFTPEP